MDLVGHNIRVVSMTPTATDIDERFDRARRWGRDVTKPEWMADLIATFAKKARTHAKAAEPSDYGCAVVFLASDDAAMITGIDLRVDAGAVTKYWAWTPPGAE